MSHFLRIYLSHQTGLLQSRQIIEDIDKGQQNAPQKTPAVYRIDLPCFSNLLASLSCSSVIFAGLPNFTPLSKAAVRPTCVLSRIKSLSNSARPEKKVITRRPVADVV